MESIIAGSASELLDSGYLVVSSLLLVITLLCVATVVLYRDKKENDLMLREMQLSDGGWGWFSGFGERSYPHTTGVVVHGLQLATQNDVAIVPGVLENGIAWLSRYQAEQVQKLKNALVCGVDLGAGQHVCDTSACGALLAAKRFAYWRPRRAR